MIFAAIVRPPAIVTPAGRLPESPAQGEPEEQKDGDVRRLDGMKRRSPEKRDAVAPPVTDAEKPQGCRHAQNQKADEEDACVRQERKRDETERDQWWIAVRRIRRYPVRELLGGGEQRRLEVDGEASGVVRAEEEDRVRRKWQNDQQKREQHVVRHHSAPTEPAF